MLVPQQELNFVDQLPAKTVKRGLGKLRSAPKLTKKQEYLYGYLLEQITNLKPAAARFLAQFLNASAGFFPESNQNLRSSFDIIMGDLPELRVSREYMAKNGNQRLVAWNDEKKALELCSDTTGLVVR